MASRTWIRGAIATAAFTALLSAPAFAQRASVVVQIAPPAPQVEVMPAVPRGQVWVPGHWRWNGSQHVWIKGHMSARRSGYVYMPAQWVSVNGRWEYREGTWVRPGNNCRDTDGDGVCDRHDKDRDGDGVRNSQDARPGNPNVGAPVYVQVPPPPPRAEPVPVMRAGQVWVPGHWRWNGREHVWIAGKYSARRSGYVYAPATWVQVGGRWEYREGTWTRPGNTCRDSDNDGVCDRHDRDRDGDGVRNSQDNRPNNPNR
ncbi:thrombospondin type 3 repeat-containing protein [Ramlibacter sp. PS3R-8]|uniref:thrombospondin type 3 repeat-containing protein n=1 Tax=Ramlibacter sp. PS3R-8 TaxID=3133437 RepID=UPI0030A89365